MGRDMVVALGEATATGSVLLAQTSSFVSRSLRRTPNSELSVCEKVQTQWLELFQPRRLIGVVGCQPRGRWGYDVAVNEYGVAACYTLVRHRMAGSFPGLCPTDLVRLATERSESAVKAVDVVTKLIEAHGVYDDGASSGNCALLVADQREAFLIETASRHWAARQIQDLYSSTDTCTIRQDWNRISSGLSTLAIEQGWWPGDGSKLDFAVALGSDLASLPDRASRQVLDQQKGAIDVGFLRQMIARRATESSGVRMPARGAAIIELARSGQLPILHYACSLPSATLYVPVFVAGELPQQYSRLPFNPFAEREKPIVHDRLGQFQDDIDRQTEEFLEEAANAQSTEDAEAVARLATHYMQHCAERTETFWRQMEKLYGVAGSLAPTGN
ncbi:MAG: hypothetical protein KatS3mg105_1231 [Gemmatales bacterium]|nr:MAG: hypothetical protein KatS3mg105_1231 [Gemmatales bacterium]